MMQALQTSTQMEFLSLSFNYCTEIDDDALRYLEMGLRELESLVTLRLKIQNSYLTNAAFSHLKHAFKKNSKIRNLELNFAGNSSLGDIGLLEITKGIKNLSNLS